MGLADVAATVPRKAAGGKCPIGTALATFTGDDLDTLNEWLDGDPRVYTGAWVGRALTQYGHKTPGAAVCKHRNGTCSCALG